MVQKVCFDTDLIISHLHGKSSDFSAIARKGIPVCISAITAFELRLEKFNPEIIEQFLLELEVVEFDNSASKIAAIIHRELYSKGTGLEIRDIFIASTCIEHGYRLMTNNTKHFSRISGLELGNIPHQPMQ